MLHSDLPDLIPIVIYRSSLLKCAPLPLELKSSALEFQVLGQQVGLRDSIQDQLFFRKFIQEA